MEAKHTKGPWKVSGTRVMDCGPGIDVICTMQVSNQPNWDADARLIAAAPDLLEVLQHIQRCLPHGSFVQIHAGSQTAADIDTAIAKATGQ